ncbi:MAG: hypothetical protein QQN55_08510 [Nitrosopumilus sp.]
MRKKKRSFKLEKRDLTVDEVLIQSSLIMIRTIADTKRDGAKIKFQTEVNGENYNIDVVIKKRKVKLYLRIVEFIKSLWKQHEVIEKVTKTVERPKMRKV